MPGPQEQRLIRALQGAEGSGAFSDSAMWRSSNEALRDVAEKLRQTRPPAHGGEAGALTAEAMAAGFAKAADALAVRAGHLSDGSRALGDAGGAIEDARAVHESLGPEGTAPSYTPHEDPGSEEGIKARNSYLADVQAFEAQQAQREEAARRAAEKLEAELDKAADVMAGLHPEEPSGPGGPGDGPGYPGGSAAGGGGGSAGRGGSVATGVLSTGSQPTFDHVMSGPRDPGGGSDGPRIGYVPGQPTPNAGGTPAEIAGGTVPVSGVGSGGGGGGGGLGLGPAGVVAGGAAAGIIGAKLGGALRGVLAGGAGGGAAGVTGRSGTAASAVRGIGTTAKSAGASTLGRGAAAASAARPGASAPAAAGRSGAAGARSGAGAGSGTGRAGSRAGASGAGAGRSGRRGTDDDGLEHERFDVGEDWVGDDDAGPGVLS